MGRQRIRTALVVFKKSAWEQHVTGKPGAEVVDAAARRAMLRAHKDNERAMEVVMRALDAAGVQHHSSARAELAPAHERRPAKATTTGKSPDLVISVGGDGTFLAASHLVTDGPILGVNSSPEHSVGFFCSAKRESFAGILDRALEGTLPIVQLHRLEASVNGVRLGHLALNDVLITHQNPGATSRYALKVGRIEELQRSSGVWISTAAGSTAGIRAAGGRVLPMTSDRIQYAVRELYVPPGEKPFVLRAGLVPKRSEVRVVCRMVDGALFVDGPRNPIELSIGDRIVVRLSRHPLHVLGLNPARGR